MNKATYQFDLLAPNPYQSKTLLNAVLDTGYYTLMTVGLHSLGPDDKIYIPKGRGPGYNNYYTNHLDVIQYPDSPGIACHYTISGFDLSPNYTQVMLPKYPNYSLGPVVGSACDSLTNKISEVNLEDKFHVQVFPNPAHDKF